MREWIGDFIQFLKSVVVRWFNVFAGAFVTTVWTIYQQLTGKSLPMTAFWSLVGTCISLAVFLAWRDQYKKSINLEGRIKPRMTVSCDDEQCILPPRISRGNPLFRVMVHLGGADLVTDVMARIKAIRKDGQKLPLLEPVRLRFHSSDSSGELKTMRPETSEPLDMLGLVSGELCLALAWYYEAFNHRCCNDPNHTYEIDVSISSSIVPSNFTYVCHWTGDFNTTKPYIKQQPLSVPSMATSQRLLTS
jgi:hypothetical protein